MAEANALALVGSAVAGDLELLLTLVEQAEVTDHLRSHVETVSSVELDGLQEVSLRFGAQR